MKSQGNYQAIPDMNFFKGKSCCLKYDSSFFIEVIIYIANCSSLLHYYQLLALCFFIIRGYNN